MVAVAPLPGLVVTVSPDGSTYSATASCEGACIWVTSELRNVSLCGSGFGVSLKDSSTDQTDVVVNDPAATGARSTTVALTVAPDATDPKVHAAADGATVHEPDGCARTAVAPPGAGRASFTWVRVFGPWLVNAVA